MIVDGHVHFYDFFAEAAFFDSALDNFRVGAAQLGLGDGWAACLMFTESAGTHHFSRFSEGTDRISRGPWTLRSTQEAHSLIACREDGERLALIAGRQIATAEGLEVLALATTERFEDGLPIPDTLSVLAERGVTPAIPWGFGKWWFQRRGVLKNVIKAHGGERLFLADSGCRPRLLPYPRLLRWAEANSHLVLAGSDPLPLRGQEGRPGSSGFLLEGRMDWMTPAKIVMTRLRALTSSPRAFGTPQRLGLFVRTQLAMQLRKWRLGRTG